MLFADGGSVVSGLETTSTSNVAISCMRRSLRFNSAHRVSIGHSEDGGKCKKNQGKRLEHVENGQERVKKKSERKRKGPAYLYRSGMETQIVINYPPKMCKISTS